MSEGEPAYGIAQLEFLQTWLRGIYEESTGVPDRRLLERLTRQMAAGGERLVPERRAAPAGEAPADDRRILGLWAEHDVLLTPGLAKTAIAAEGGYGKRRRSRSTSPVGSRRTRRCSTSPGSRRSLFRPDSGPTGCR